MWTNAYNGKNMARNPKILSIVLLAALVFVGYMVYQYLYTFNHLSEAYAAWDTGTLLIEYMDTNEGNWPTSWEDLVGLIREDEDHRVMLRGARAGDVAYVVGLRDVVSIQWSVVPSADEDFSPVSRIDGTDFPVLWEGADPNEMVREYMRNLAAKD